MTTPPPSLLTPAGELSVRLHGAGGLAAPVIAVHDLGAGPRVWDRVASRLASAGHPVAAVDLSSPTRADLPSLAGAVASVAAHLDWWPIVVGHRWGAAVALQLAAGHPSAARAHVWIDGGVVRLADRFPDLPTAIAATAAPLVPADPARAARLVGLQHPDWDADTVAASLDGLGALTPFERAALVEGWWAGDPAALWPQVTPPVTLVAVDDPAVSATRAAPVDDAALVAAFRALLRSSTHHVEGDDSLLLDRPDLVAALVSAAPGLIGPG